MPKDKTRRRLEALEEARRARAAAELRKILYDVSDDEMARMLVSFRRGGPEEQYVPKALADAEDVADEALGYRWWDLPAEEFERRFRLIFGPITESRGDDIRARAAELDRCTR